MKAGYLLVFTWLIWVAIGAFWMLPQKLALQRRFGFKTNSEFIALAKSGDAEAQRFRRRGWWYFGIGLAVLVPQVFVLQLMK